MNAQSERLSEPALGMSACPGKQPLLAVWRKQRASQRRATQGGQWTWQDRHLCGRGPALSTQGRRTARYTVLSSWAPPELSSWVHLLLLPRVRLSTSAVVLAGPSCPALLHPALTQPGLSDCVMRVGEHAGHLVFRVGSSRPWVKSQVRSLPLCLEAVSFFFF